MFSRRMGLVDLRAWKIVAGQNQSSVNGRYLLCRRFALRSAMLGFQTLARVASPVGATSTDGAHGKTTTP
jgi:hypothetical protein